MPRGRPKDPDQEKVAKNKAYCRAVCQARYRGEAWSLTREEYFHIWGEYWPLRGRSVNDYCMIMRNPKIGWTADNAMIVKRKDFITTIQKDNTRRRRYENTQ